MVYGYTNIGPQFELLLAEIGDHVSFVPKQDGPEQPSCVFGVSTVGIRFRFKIEQLPKEHIYPPGTSNARFCQVLLGEVWCDCFLAQICSHQLHRYFIDETETGYLFG